MFLVRRTAILNTIGLPSSEAWKAANLLSKVCNAYEDNNDRGKAVVYIGGTSTPGDEIIVCAEWYTDSIEYNDITTVPKTVIQDNTELSQLVKKYTIEFFEVATEEKLAARFS